MFCTNKTFYFNIKVLSVCVCVAREVRVSSSTTETIGLLNALLGKTKESNGSQVQWVTGGIR